MENAESRPILENESMVAPTATPASAMADTEIPGIRFVDYKDESQLDSVMSLVGRDLSEPYSSKFSATTPCVKLRKTSSNTHALF